MKPSFLKACRPLGAEPIGTVHADYPEPNSPIRRFAPISARRGAVATFPPSAESVDAAQMTSQVPNVALRVSETISRFGVWFHGEALHEPNSQTCYLRIGGRIFPGRRGFHRHRQAALK